jgi:hypothetical protein
LQRTTKRNILDGPYDLANGWSLRVSVKWDDGLGPPWKEYDGHGPVSDWRKSDSKSPGERPLITDRGLSLFYDWQEAIKLAKREGWGCRHRSSGPNGADFNIPPKEHKTKGEERACSVQSDFDYCRRYAEDQWHWVGIVVILLDEEDKELGEDSCWGYSSDNHQYLNTEAREFAAHLIATARTETKRIALHNAEREADIYGVACQV